MTTTSTTTSSATPADVKDKTSKIRVAVGIVGALLILSIGIATFTHSDKLTIPINTTEWTVVKTDGRDFENKFIIVDGVTLKYYIAINNIDNPIELPANKEVKYGLPENIKVVYFRLKPGQGYSDAEVPFNFE